MTHPKPSNKRRLSISSCRKASNSKYWRERSRTIKIMDEQTAIFIEQSNIRVIHPEESANIKASVSTVINSKGKIIVK